MIIRNGQVVLQENVTNTVENGNMFPVTSNAVSSLIKKHIYSVENFPISGTGATPLTYTVPNDCRTVLSVMISKSWPTATWNNGAIVNIEKTFYSENKIELVTNSAQNYNMELTILYLTI